MNAIRGQRTKTWRVSARLALGLTAVLLLAGCSSAGAGYGSTGATSTAPSSAVAGAAIVGTATGDLGTYLTADDGRAVYLWEADSSGGSACTGACASVWPPVLTSAAPQASGGADVSLLGTIPRPEGGLQVTYQGHPLYYFANDTSAGQTAGQGSNGFGAKWWLVAPSGDAITGSGSSSTSSASAAGRGGYGY